MDGEQAMNNLTESLSKEGLRFVYTKSWHPENVPDKIRVRKFIINNPDLIRPYIESLTHSEYREFLKTAVEEEADLYGNSDFWAKFLTDLADLSDEETSRNKSNDIIREADCEYLLAAKLIPNHDWKDMYEKVVIGLASYRGWFPRQLSFITKSLIEQDSQYFIDSVSERVFSKDASPKPNCTFRGVMYKLYIEGGFLDKKTARKIRSDGSEESSVYGVKALIDNEDLYDNYAELILKFTDSKYDGVLMELARNLPIHLLTSIMGCNDYWVKNTIEKRLEAHEAEKLNPQEEGVV